MLAIDQAAKFLVVGWVKDWSMRTLLGAITESRETPSDQGFREFSEAIPFMPEWAQWYLAGKGRGLPVRQFVADAYPKLSSALWAASDNEARLKLAPQIVRLQARGATPKTKYSRADLNSHELTRRTERAATSAYHLSRAAFKTHGRSAWNVCK